MTHGMTSCVDFAHVVTYLEGILGFYLLSSHVNLYSDIVPLHYHLT